MSPPVAISVLSMVVEVWWLKTITSLPADWLSRVSSQANCAWSTEPSE